MPKLDARLRMVASLIHGPIHVDIGSDHAGLLVMLLATGRIQKGIAIENKARPLENSRAALDGYLADVRYADGLAGIESGEVDSLSMCGIGGETIVKILETHPERIPETVILQPNRAPECIRRWALDNHFRLTHEAVVNGHWPYQILCLKRGGHQQDGVDGERSARSDRFNDPAYEGVALDAAMLFGPLNLKRSDPWFLGRLKEEYHYLSQFDRMDDKSQERFTALKNFLTSFDHGFTNDSRNAGEFEPS